MKLLVGHCWHSSQILYLAYLFCQLTGEPQVGQLCVVWFDKMPTKKMSAVNVQTFFSLTQICMPNVQLLFNITTMLTKSVCIMLLYPWPLATNHKTFEIRKNWKYQFVHCMEYMEVTWTAVLVTGLTSTDRYFVCLSLTR